MKKLLVILEKEFRQIFRNPAILRMVLVMPVMQLILFPLAANYEVKNVLLSIVDHDHSSYSQKFINKISGSGYFKLTDFSPSYNQALESIESGKADLIVEIPAGFERNLVKESTAPILIAVNAVNGAKASLGGAYAANIIRDFNADIQMEWIRLPKMNAQPTIEVTSSNWYNSTMNYKLYMVPGILVTLLTLIASFLAALNIVHEKEIGTIEQINVSPITKVQFILGKLIPFWIMGLITLTLGLLVSRLFYSIIPVGSIALIYLFGMVFLFTLLGVGLLVSTYAETQTQATFVSFFVMMLFMLLGGLYTPIESMPEWAKWITKINPVAYFIEVMRMVVLKGSSFSDVTVQFFSVLGLGIIFNSWAVINYKKEVDS
ncbi:MAG: ABC transporter permease [Chitinophagaceae bacterium]|nr:ABC transporter permease [Chitinophagaceae bacterium]